MCVDYTDLNKHCPKDPFGLPRIDQVIDSTAGCDLLCLLDYYSGYHQIQGRRPGEDCIHHPIRRLLLHDDVVRVEERRRHLTASYLGLLQEEAQQEHQSLCG
jgi:hypothetical protein